MICSIAALACSCATAAATATLGFSCAPYSRQALLFAASHHSATLILAAVVPIESLLYRGRAALDREVEIRDRLRAAPASDPSALEELFDLRELARVD